jgi:hypothetical protein
MSLTAEFLPIPVLSVFGLATLGILSLAIYRWR